MLVKEGLKQLRNTSWRLDWDVSKEVMTKCLHKGAVQISVPLIIDPTAGRVTCEMKKVCKRFEDVIGMRVVVQERAGDSVKHTAKAEPLRN